MKIVEMNVENLIPYINNPRDNEEAIKHVAASIKEFGFKVPILIDQQNVIVAGHTRILAARLLELKKVPVIKIEDLSPSQLKAFRIADNKVSEFADWDMEKLKIEFEELQGMEEELDSEFFTGFDEFEKHDLLKETIKKEEFPPADEKNKIGYTLIFRNHEDLQTWTNFISGLKSNRENRNHTIADLVLEYIDA